jgi:hypothetical protein
VQAKKAVNLPIKKQNRAMNIGDKVRVVHGREEGVVVGLLPKNLVEVMLSDGFKIPFTKSDLVVVSAIEEKVFTKEQSEESTKTPLSKTFTFAEKGIFLAKTQESDGKHVFHLVNNTDFQVLFTCFLLSPSQESKPLAFGTLNKKTSMLVFQTEQVSQLEESKMMMQMLFFAQGRNELRLPLVRETTLKVAKWKADPEILPLIGKKGTKVQLDISLAEQDAKTMEEQIGNRTSTPSSPSLKPNPELDLHIEKLVNDPYTLKPDEMLRFQLRAFENHLEKSISAGLKEVTYIHGIGNGTLKTEIAKKLSSNIFIKHYEDARRDKYGYGATKVVLK